MIEIATQEKPPTGLVTKDEPAVQPLEAKVAQGSDQGTAESRIKCCPPKLNGGFCSI